MFRSLLTGQELNVYWLGFIPVLAAKKAWSPLMMFKALLLQSWSALEKQLALDLLCRRFISLSISASVPDHSTLWRFRQLLEKQSLM
jgi:IS5 family transposase